MAATEARTAHHVRRLHASIRDLQNALGVYAQAERPLRPPRDAVTFDTRASDDPQSRILANNDRGAVQRIERLHELGAVVLGLESVGALVADALCRYGVKRLVVGDTTERGLGDLDMMTCYVRDLGLSRERHVAAVAHQLDPEIHVFPLGLPLSDAPLVVASLRAMLTPPDDEEKDVGEHDHSSADSSESDGERDDRTPLNITDEQCFVVVFLCGAYPDLAMALNELCCEFGVQFVYVTMGRNGLSGDAISVAPGRSACLQCLEKRKMLKLSAVNRDDALGYSIGLPTTECVLAGIAVQHAFAHLLDAGPVCSRVEYDGYREEFDRSGFVAPVHQCPSVHCRQQQQFQRPPPTAS